MTDFDVAKCKLLLSDSRGSAAHQHERELEAWLDDACDEIERLRGELAELKRDAVVRFSETELLVTQRDSLAKRVEALRAALQSLLNPCNAVTSNHRHGVQIPKWELDRLSNRQIEVEALLSADTKKAQDDAMEGRRMSDVPDSPRHEIWEVKDAATVERQVRKPTDAEIRAHKLATYEEQSRNADLLMKRLALLETIAAAARKLRDSSRWYQPMGENRCIPDEAALVELFHAADALDASQEGK